MKTFIKKDITTETDGIILNGVNCKGVMGSGLAKAIRNKWPIVYSKYKELSFSDRLLGYVQFVKITDNLLVANCFTQDKYGSDGAVYANIDAIKLCIQSVFEYADSKNLTIKAPKIGCGLGGLSWDDDVLPVFLDLEKTYPNVIVTYIEL